jgi:hypothetical protein
VLDLWGSGHRTWPDLRPGDDPGDLIPASLTNDEVWQQPAYPCVGHRGSWDFSSHAAHV